MMNEKDNHPGQIIIDATFFISRKGEPKGDIEILNNFIPEMCLSIRNHILNKIVYIL